MKRMRIINPVRDVLVEIVSVVTIYEDTKKMHNQYNKKYR